MLKKVETSPLLSVRNLRIEFPTRRGTLVAVDDISFDIAPGEILGVVGESGAGKSLTGAAIIGLLEPPGRIAQGEITLEGQRIDNLPYEEIRRIRGRRIGAIFQDPLTSLNPLYSVSRQLVETIQTHLPLNDKEARARALELLDEVGIPGAGERIDHYPHQFSGGMRQRVVIALALCAEPRLIIADEPTTALDVTIQAQILHLLRTLARERDVAVLFTTHDLGTTYEICDRVTVMYAGQEMETAPSDGFFNTPSHPYTRDLLQSLPSREHGIKGIPGDIPALISPPGGCRFHPRCTAASERCSVERPDHTQISERHNVRCFHPVAHKSVGAAS